MAVGLTQDQLRVVRSWVGDETEESTLQERYARLDNLDGVILEEMRAQLAVALESPSSFSVDGISLSYNNITALRERINDFVKVGGTGLEEPPPAGGTRAFQLVRPEVR